MRDNKIFELIDKEAGRQQQNVELIASENFVSKQVLEATGSVLTNKYAEGYPFKRYYDGGEFVDQIEQLAIDRLKELFGVEYANVQPHSGSQANAAVYLGLLNPGEKILGMSLSSGGHLTHGFKVSSSGKYYETAAYEVDENGLIDYDEVRRIAIEFKPKLIITGYSAYSRTIDFKKFKEIAEEVGAILMADIAHIAGLVATGLHPSPVGIADVITLTTHKTLRGARGGAVITNDPSIAKKINSAVFPGLQGGPLLHSIAGKAVAFFEALQPEFKEYSKQIIKNAQAFANRFIELGIKVISGGTDNHLFTIDVKGAFGITGAEASTRLDNNNITANKNTIPHDTESPMVTSGVRFGTPAMTTVGWVESDFIELANIIHDILKDDTDAKNKIKALISKYI